jgi:hypothetical protein
MKNFLLGIVGLIATYLGACTIQMPPNYNNTPTTENVPNQGPPTIIYGPTQPNPSPAVKLSPAPIIKYGPGTANNMQGPSEGYVTVRTNSANGKLSLRPSPDQNTAAIVEIPNGTSGIYFNQKVQNGDHVWYYSYYGNYKGWLRGDYLTVKLTDSIYE